MMINPEKIDLLKSIEDYKDSISNDLEQLEKFDRSCCDNAEYEALMNVEAAQIQAMQHLTMHKQLLSGNSEDPVTALLELVK